MNNLADIAFKAGRLFHYACNIRERPGVQNQEYAQLVQDYHSLPEMQRIFDAFADACLLEVLEVSAAGAFLAPKSGGRRQGSAFSYRLTDYKTFEDPRERVLHGVIQLVIASFVFPSPERLEDPIDSLGAPVRVAQLVEHLDRLLEQFKQSSQRMPSENPDEDPVWQQLRMLVREMPTETGRQARHTLARHVQIACAVLEREGFFRKQEARPGDPEKFIPLPQYRVHVRHLADHRRLYQFVAKLKGEVANA
jgi:hypothetical protein